MNVTEDIFVPEEYVTAYTIGKDEGSEGKMTPDNNPYEDVHNRFWWGEGFFDGYKQFLNERNTQ